MSDFLSNFTSDKYKKDAEEHKLVMPDTEVTETDIENSSVASVDSDTLEDVTPDLSEVDISDAVSDEMLEDAITSDFLMKHSKAKKMKKTLLMCQKMN